MASIEQIKASDGSANASVATVQTTRAALATTIIVDTVAGINTVSFAGSMGTPHTFTDPITSEIITVISETTVVDFVGHVDGSNLEIDTIAPGYTDLGSAVGDIVIIRPTTQYANNLASVLGQSLNDDGTFKNSAITYQPIVFDHVASGAILAGLGYGTTLTASLSAGVCYINGIIQTIAVVATRTYTASKDTYVDALYNATGIATIVYTEVANNNASPALASNSIRIGIIVSGATITAVGAVNQGQENKVLPIASSISYAVTDSLGNLICPRDPQRKILGYRQIVSPQTGITTEVDITGLSVPFIAIDNRKINVVFSSGIDGGAVTQQPVVTLREGATSLRVMSVVGGPIAAVDIEGQVVITPSAGLHTYKATLQRAGSAAAVATSVSSTNPGHLRVELA